MAREKIVRLDLEAVGWAPFGFELAQLTDDFPLLDQSVEAWGVRHSCFLIYAQTLGVLDDDEQMAAAWEAYLLSLAVRAARPLSSGIETRKALAALELLVAVAARSTRRAVLDLCGELRTAWEQRRPQPTTAISDVLVELFEPNAQIRASKRLAHLLRHDEDVVRDEHGWVDLEIVVDRFAVMRDYARLPNEDLSRFVITLIQRYDEARFEYREGRVRAKYGQSVPVAYQEGSGQRSTSAPPTQTVPRHELRGRREHIRLRWITAAQESILGAPLQRRGRGPARGLAAWGTDRSGDLGIRCARGDPGW